MNQIRNSVRIHTVTDSPGLPWTVSGSPEERLTLAAAVPAVLASGSSAGPPQMMEQTKRRRAEGASWLQAAGSAARFSVLMSVCPSSLLLVPCVLFVLCGLSMMLQGCTVMITKCPNQRLLPKARVVNL